MNGRAAAIPVPEVPEGKNSMHLPFYQTNTSQYCPLYAACTKGSRSAQMPVRNAEVLRKTGVFISGASADDGEI